MFKHEGVADLHIHTTASDGTCSVQDRVKQASDLNIGAIAITDHDTIAATLTSRVTHHNGLELVTGVEVRADVDNTKVELLGYYLDPTDERLERILEMVRSYRRERNQQIITRLNETTSLDIQYREIQPMADGILGRPHIADLLVNEGIVDSIGAAFEQYLGSSGTAFVPMKRVPAKDVIEAIQNAGGVVSLAHPGRVRTDDIESIIQTLAAQGLDALEVPYPYGDIADESYADVAPKDAAEFAEQFDLLQTGGSDCHGANSDKFRIGQIRITQSSLDEIRQLSTDRCEL